jgi:DNA-binding transcriptional ArsR family regulator
VDANVPPNAELLELVARRFQILGDATRMRILAMLSGSEVSVQDLTSTLPGSQQTISKHLGILFQAGMIARRRDGNYVYYRLADYVAPRLIKEATASVTGRVEELASIVGIEA